jgi:hypothetical protein
MRGKSLLDCCAVKDTGWMKLFDDGVMIEEVLAHPRHHAAQKTLAELIEQLRACANVEEGYAFQQALLTQVLAVEADRNALSQAVKRIAGHKKPQADAPEPQSGLDPAAPETWQLEHDVCERIARQYRCVGDALAWRRVRAPLHPRPVSQPVAGRDGRQ